MGYCKGEMMNMEVDGKGCICIEVIVFLCGLIGFCLEFLIMIFGIGIMILSFLYYGLMK